MADEGLHVLLSSLREDVTALIRSHERLAGKVETLERVVGTGPASAPRRSRAKTAGLGAGAGVVAAALLELAQVLLQRPAPPPASAPNPPAIVRQAVP